MKRSAPTVKSNSQEPSNKRRFLCDGPNDELQIDSTGAADGGGASSASSALPKVLPDSELAVPGLSSDSAVAVPTLLARRNYVNDNYILRFDFAKCVPNLPEQLESLLKMNMAETIENRQRVLDNGETPYFYIKNGLNPTTKWTEEFREFIQQHHENSFLMAKETHVPQPQKRLQSATPRRTDSTAVNVPAQEEATEHKLSAEQRQCVCDCVRLLFSGDTDRYKPFHVLLLHGDAGTGKTFILSQLKKIRRIKLEYVTITRLLCHDISKKYRINTSTICKFFMDRLHLKYSNCRVLQEGIAHVDHQRVLRCPLFESFASTVHRRDRVKWHRVLQNHPKTFPIYFDKKTSFVFFLDEFSLLPASIIALFLNICEILTQLYNWNVVVIVSGHVQQIQPLFILPNNEYAFIANMATHCYELQQQHRVMDTEYRNVLSEIRNVDGDTSAIRLLLKETFADTDNREIDYIYPIHRIHKGVPVECEDILSWFEEEKIFEICNIIIFSFSNAELQYHNISLAKSIHHQLSQYPDISPFDYVQFQILQHIIGRRKIWGYPASPEIDGKAPILALIRFFPYKVLAQNVPELPRSSIVYLIDWTETHAIVYSRVNRVLIALQSCPFHMNLYRRQSLYGFPLQLHVGETFYSSQGLTITRNICANFSKATVNEIYVILSRVSGKSLCKAIHIP